jgi:hypothetical protein
MKNFDTSLLKDKTLIQVKRLSVRELALIQYQINKSHNKAGCKAINLDDEMLERIFIQKITKGKKSNLDSSSFKNIIPIEFSNEEIKIKTKL